MSAAYCDSKFLNASADCLGVLWSSDPGTVWLSVDDVCMMTGVFVLTMFVHVSFE